MPIAQRHDLGSEVQDLKKEGKMIKKLVSFTTLSLLLVGFLAAASWAGSVDEKIKAMEEELARLKEEKRRENQEEIEIKKEATAAAAPLRTFTYRPGRGVTLAAGDRAWSMETNY